MRIPATGCCTHRIARAAHPRTPCVCDAGCLARNALANSFRLRQPSPSLPAWLGLELDACDSAARLSSGQRSTDKLPHRRGRRSAQSSGSSSTFLAHVPPPARDGTVPRSIALPFPPVMAGYSPLLHVHRNGSRGDTVAYNLQVAQPSFHIS